MRTFLQAIACLALGLGTVISAQPASSASHAERALRQAQDALGGPGRVAAIKTLTIEGTLHSTSSKKEPDPFEFDLAFPDRFRWRTATVAHVVDGSHFWQSVPTPTTLLVRAEQNVRRTITLNTVLLLARTTSALPLQTAYVGQIERGGLRGEAVDLKGPEDFSMTLFLDSQSHLPIGYTTPFQMQNSSGAIGDVVLKVVQVMERQVQDGMSFPSKIQETTGPYQSTREITRVAINPTLDPSLFEKPTNQ